MGEGTIVRCFDNNAFAEYGHDYLGESGNLIFYRVGKIIHITPKTKHEAALYDIKWLGTNVISRAHFREAFMVIQQPNNQVNFGM